MKTTQFVIRPDCTESIWDDGAKSVLDELGEVEIKRASHIDPVRAPVWYTWLNPGNWKRNRQILRFLKKHGSGKFGIFWKGDVAHWGMTLADEDGIPFTTKKSAVDFEVRTLQTDYFQL